MVSSSVPFNITCLLVQSNAVILDKPDNTPSLSLNINNGNNFEECMLNVVQCHLVDFKVPMDKWLSQDLECTAADAICLAFQIVQRCHVTPAPISHPHAPTETTHLQEPIEVVQKQPFLVHGANPLLNLSVTHVPLGEGVKLHRAKPPHSNQTPGPSPPLSPWPAKAVIFTSAVLPENKRLLSPMPSDPSLSSLESPEPKAKILKLPGEVGRPGRGGYNLEE
ncbi:hypothetical protein BKA83DRAFT_4132884 [Pisolithus microcarpus]|nr:hypothetical protein BKA83DRAFT_4132884 [Pisolithus microcarpus]